MENRLKYLIGLLVMNGLLFKLMNFPYENEMFVISSGLVVLYSIYKLTKKILVKYIIGVGFGVGFLLKSTSQPGNEILFGNDVLLGFGNQLVIITWFVGIVYCVYRMIKG